MTGKIASSCRNQFLVFDPLKEVTGEVIRCRLIWWGPHSRQWGVLRSLAVKFNLYSL